MQKRRSEIVLVISRCFYREQSLSWLYTDASASYTRNRDNCKAADIFSLASCCTQSPPRPSDLDTETSFFYRFFFLRALRVSRQRRNVTCSPAGFLRNDRMNQIWRYINAPNYAACWVGKKTIRDKCNDVGSKRSIFVCDKWEQKSREFTDSLFHQDKISFLSWFSR